MGNLGKLIVATVYEKLSKVQKIAESGHTAQDHSARTLSLEQLLNEHDNR